jgi:hypothetical protein
MILSLLALSSLFCCWVRLIERNRADYLGCLERGGLSWLPLAKDLTW